MNTPETRIISGHEITYAVVDLIKHAQTYLILATAYVKPWSHLTREIERAVERGVTIHFIVRSPEGPTRERERTQDAINEVSRLGVKVHLVERLHAKAYISETCAIVTSFNLVNESQNSLELGVILHNKPHIQECIKALSEYCQEISNLDSSSAAPPRTKPVLVPSPGSAQSEGNDAAFCIGCGDSSHPFDMDKPLCRNCYHKSARGSDASSLPKRVCHLCGEPNKSTLEKPLCYACYKKASKAGLIASP